MLSPHLTFPKFYQQTFVSYCLIDEIAKTTGIGEPECLYSNNYFRQNNQQSQRRKMDLGSIIQRLAEKFEVKITLCKLICQLTRNVCSQISKNRKHEKQENFFFASDESIYGLNKGRKHVLKRTPTVLKH